MTNKDFILELGRFRKKFELNLHFNAESPKRIQITIEDALSYLGSFKFEGSLKQEVAKAKKWLKLAHQNANEFSKTMKPDLTTSNDLAVQHQNPTFWYQEVIGNAEDAIDIITRHLNETE